MNAIKFLGLCLLLGASYSSTVDAQMCGSNTLDSSDVTFDTFDAVDCGGSYSVNNSNINVNTHSTGGLTFGGSDWGSEIKDDSPGGGTSGTGTFLGIDWTLNADSGKTGSWSLSIAAPSPASLPVTVDLLAVLKGSNKWGAYLFTDHTFTLPGSTKGTFEIAFTNNGNKIPNLSHMSLYLREGVSPAPAAAPIPAAAWLFGPGLLGLAGVIRKKKKGSFEF